MSIIRWRSSPEARGGLSMSRSPGLATQLRGEAGEWQTLKACSDIRTGKPIERGMASTRKIWEGWSNQNACTSGLPPTA